MKEKFILITELIQYKHPYYKASESFKESLEDFDPNQKQIIISKIHEFKRLKTLNPQDLIHSANWKDHALRGPLGQYYEAHLIYGHICLVYYHGGRYILLLDIVPHSVLTAKNKSNSLSIQLNNITPPLKKYVESKLAYWDHINL